MPYRPKPKKLRNIIIDRIDLCNKGANQDAHIVLFKNKDKSTWLAMFKKAIEAMTTAEVLNHDEMMDEFWNTHDALMKSIYSIMESEVDNKNELMKQSIKEFLTAMGKIDFSKKEEQLKKGVFEKFMSNLAKAVGMSDDAVAEIQKEISAPHEEGTTMLETTEETITKADLNAIQKKAEENIAKANQIASEAIAKARELEEELALERFTKRAEEIYPSIPGDPKEKGRLLKALHDKLGKEDDEKIQQMLAAGEAAFKEAGLFKAQGRDGVKSFGSAWEEITKKADALVAEKKVPTREQGVDLVVKQHPDLYKRYIEENRVQ